MRYCTRCVMPATKPYLEFDEEGLCSACRAHEEKDAEAGSINWDRREEKFEAIIHEAERTGESHYDAVVPVSGGKDSITQVHYLLEYDLQVLAVNVDYGIKTPIGRRNLKLVADMGADLITFRPSQTVHKEVIRIGFEDYGDPDLMSHCLLHSYPLRVAMRFDVPLVLLGEDSAFEYSGDEDLVQDNQMNRVWFERYAANDGVMPSTIAREYGFDEENLVVYDYPDGFDESSTKAVFTSHFFHWDSEKHLDIAREYGFEMLDEPDEGTYRNYVGIDERINRIHQYLKVLKFGYGRATDHACEDIRNGRLTREEAKELVREHDLEPLSDEYVKPFCEYLGYSHEEFFEVLEQYRNDDIWERNHNGEWVIPDHLDGELVES